MILVLTYIYILLILACFIMAAIYLTNRLSSLSRSDLELRRRLDYAEIADETIIEKVEKLDVKINIVLERTLTQGTKIRDLENKKPLD